MIKNYIHVKCENGCNCSFIGYSYKGQIDEDYMTCEHCGKFNAIYNFDEIRDADVIIEIIGSELENSNYHSMTSLPTDIWNSVKEHIPEKDRYEVAKKIADAFTSF